MTTAKPGNKVKIHLTETLDSGKEVVSTRGSEPFQFVLGKNHVIKGLDDAVTGMKIGDIKKVRVKAGDAYGMKKKKLYIPFERDKLPKTLDLKIGMRLKLNQRRGDPIPVRISEITEDEVIFDANHPLAGKDLIFEIKLLEVA
jgi:peptidylprolyl isomerase